MLLVISKLTNSSSTSAKLNFFGFGVMPFLPHMSSQFAAWRKQSLMLSALSRMSLMHLVLDGNVETISSYLLEYPSPEAM